MTLHRVAVLLVLGLGGVSRGLYGQERSVTLADAIRLSERVQPTVVRAAGDVETAAAQRRSAWGGYLPSLSANSSASTFSSEGPSRVDPTTGQLVSGNILEPEPERGALRQPGSVHRLPAGCGDGRRPRQPERRRGLVCGRALSAGARDDQPVSGRTRLPATGRRARDQRSPGRGAAQDLDREAARGLCHSIRLPSLTRYSGERAARPDPGPDRPCDGGSRSRAADRRDRPGEGARRFGLLPDRGAARHHRAPYRGRGQEPANPERECRCRRRARRSQGLPRGLLAQSLAVRQHGMERKPLGRL